MLEKIVAAVRAAGDMIRDAHNIERDTREKTGAADLVTKYDVAVQEFLRRELLGICPEADFFGEEGQPDPAGSGRKSDPSGRQRHRPQRARQRLGHQWQVP